MRMYLLERHYYGDFDSLQTEPVAVSSIRGILVEEADKLNSRRSNDEIENGVEYVINPERIKVI